MKNYVLMYNLADEKSGKELIKQLNKKFPRHKSVIENNFTYFSFAEKGIPAVQDAIQETMAELTLEETDYIALFYTRAEEPDIIHRLMLFGTSNIIENNLKKISRTIHERVLAELLESDLINNKV